MAHGVLIIEDETVLAKNIRLYLERSGFDARAAASPEDGMQQIREFRPDIIVLDYQLPGRNGLDLLAELSRDDPGIPVIVLTGQASVDMAVEAMKRGAVDFLTKPVVLGKLRLVIEKVLGAEAALGDDEPPAVLITGETGTGKEVLARAVHYDGPRRSGPFIELNCGSIPAQLLESELFGHERGAFTDAKERKLGLVEAADGGSLFLDEIGDMDAVLQVKLLKLLEEKTVRRLGSVRDQKVNVRIIAATHQPLEQLVSEGRFRSDLFFRLRIVQLALPPLRERGDDILLLAGHFLAHQSTRYNKGQLRFSAAAERAMLGYRWPGNDRELRNVIEQTVLLASDQLIEPSQLPFCAVLGSIPENASAAAPKDVSLSLEQAERELLAQALDKAAWNVTLAARLLGISRDTLRYRIEKHGLSRDA
jgi:DNA-binding NtrC family response regulator